MDTHRQKIRRTVLMAVVAVTAIAVAIALHRKLSETPNIAARPDNAVAERSVVPSSEDSGQRTTESRQLELPPVVRDNDEYPLN
jgi:anti-sigma-K factor RskA